MAKLFAQSLFRAKHSSSGEYVSLPLLPLRVPGESPSDEPIVATPLQPRGERGRRVQFVDPMKFRYDFFQHFHICACDLMLGLIYDSNSLKFNAVAEWQSEYIECARSCH